MDDHRRGIDIAALIEALAHRSEFETARLMATLRNRPWPGGHADRTEPAALEWVRRWGPARLAATPLDCSCRRGRCAVCN